MICGFYFRMVSKLLGKGFDFQSFCLQQPPANRSRTHILFYATYPVISHGGRISVYTELVWLLHICNTMHRWRILGLRERASAITGTGNLTSNVPWFASFTGVQQCSWAPITLLSSSARFSLLFFLTLN